MAYNRRNKLRFISAVIEVYKAEKKDGISVQHVYRTHIYPRFKISQSTLYNYLSIPAEKLLKEEVAKTESSQNF